MEIYQRSDDPIYQLINDQLGKISLHILDLFGVEYRLYSNQAVCPCPIHGGNNETGFKLYFEETEYKVNYKCYTHQCHRYFGTESLGLVQALLSSKNGWRSPSDISKVVPLDEVLKYITKDDKFSIENLELLSEEEVERKNFCLGISSYVPKPPEKPIGPHKTEVKRLIDIPSPYYLHRGYRADTLQHFLVGDCYNPKKEMFRRAVVPIFDSKGYLLGASGRSIFQRCEVCKGYHDPAASHNKKCPKWFHSKGLKTTKVLYNFDSAFDDINENRSIVIVESPGNVWRLHEWGIKNAVATFGIGLSSEQLIVLNSGYIMNVLILYDNDDAGKQGGARIARKLERTHNVRIITPPVGDVAELNESQMGELVEQVKKGFWF